VMVCPLPPYMLIAPCEKPLNASPLTCISMLSSAAAPT
jgi:hypothetical protein